MNDLRGTNIGFSYARRSEILAQDLVDLGISDLEITNSPQCNELFDLITLESLAGVLYVVEGAMLGGSQIDRAAHKLRGHDRPAGRRYWAWCRFAAKLRWPMTNQYLQHLCDQGVAPENLAKGASDTFELLGEWFEPLNRPRLVLVGGQM